jgi:uncharacterized iron-regulated protein
VQINFLSHGFVVIALTLVGALASAQIIDVRIGKEVDESALVEILKSADFVLLGELHDNKFHHEARGRLIARFADHRRSVVSEHMPAPNQVNFQSVIKEDLQAAGFDAEGWDWPIHQSLYEQIKNKGLTVVGGNLPKEEARRMFLQGANSLPERMAKTYSQSPLDQAAERKLDHDLVEGHCGKLPEKYLLRMRFAQRMTDLSLSHNLLDRQPSILIAGNGHVRRDYGVPQILASVAPERKVVSVGFLEQGSDSQDLLQSVSGQYDFIWITERAERKDPCESFTLK